VVVFCIIGSILGILAFAWSGYPISQSSLSYSGAISSRPVNTLLTSATAIQMTLPNDMSSFAGALYSIDCGTSAASTVVIGTGAQSTYWYPWTTYRTMTCAAAGGGVTFRVLSASLIRVIAATNVTFS
jgi:hypothetical protein